MSERSTEPPCEPASPGAWEGPCAWLAWLLPLALMAGSNGTGPRWQDDLAIVRDLGLVPAGFEGALSSVATQLLALVPVGTRSARAALLGALALAACSGLLYALVRELLDARRRLASNPVLALLGALIWALSPGVRDDASGPGSPALALLLILFGAWLTRRLAADARAVPLAGAALGLAVGESHAAALLLCALLLAEWLREPVPVADAPWLRFVAGFVAAAGASWLVPTLRGVVPGGLDLGWRALPAPAELGPTASSVWLGWGESLRQGLAPPLERLGLVPLLLALSGAVAGWASGTFRRALAPWALLVLAGTLGGVGLAGAPQTRVLCALASSAGLAAFLPLGLQAALHWLWSRPVPLARPASVLGLSFAVTLVLQRLESVAPHASVELAVERWTEEALGRLPAHSVALVQSPELGLRLLAAQLSEGARADVALVPMPLLHRGSVTQRLLAGAPELAPLLRQLAVNGVPDEYSLARLADARPLFVELDSRWDARLLEHLRPDALWLGFASQAAGKRDRQAGAARSGAALRRLIEEGDLRSELDAATRRVLARQARQQALAWAALGETGPAEQVLHWLRRLEPGDAWARKLALRLDQSGGRVAVNDLLAGADTGSP